MERLAMTCGREKPVNEGAGDDVDGLRRPPRSGLGGRCRIRARRRAAIFTAIEQYSYSWGALPLLPLRYQNHCGLSDGHYVCADRCGVDYQVYYCSAAAVGCCHVGFGYCDGAGHMRCMPALFEPGSGAQRRDLERPFVKCLYGGERRRDARLGPAAMTCIEHELVFDVGAGQRFMRAAAQIRLALLDDVPSRITARTWPVKFLG